MCVCVCVSALGEEGGEGGVVHCQITFNAGDGLAQGEAGTMRPRHGCSLPFSGSFFYFFLRASEGVHPVMSLPRS